MALNIFAQKCACGGKLEFDTVKKIWICKYCGTVVEREATFDKVHVDGIEGVDDVVRQTLMDIANHKLDSAARNLEDCERKGHKHIGTLLANISYNLACISDAKTKDQMRAGIDKVKIFNERLRREYPVIAEDEINLYESFGEEAADIFANLLVVFDTLQDESRVEYIFSMLKSERIFSKHANKTLLKVAIKRGYYDIVDNIIDNIGHVERSAALKEILDKYPCNDNKAVLTRKVFDAKSASDLTKRYFEEYFTNTLDSLEFKAVLVGLLNSTEIHVNADTVVKNSGEQLNEYNGARQLFDSIYDVRISDQETEALLVFCLMVNKKYGVQKAFFDTLTEKNVFVSLSARAVISFMEDSIFESGQKAEIVERMLVFCRDAKALDAIYNFYLNTGIDSPDVRLMIIDKLLTPGIPISTATIKKYVISSQADGENKLTVLDRILATGINKTYLGDLLSEYMLNTSDPENIKEKVFEYLTDQGFKVDSGVLMRYISTSRDDAEKKAEKVRHLIRNNTQVKSETLDSYLCSIQNPGDFSAEMFNLLSEQSFVVSLNAYVKFLLFCNDPDKIRHNEKMLFGLNVEISDQKITVNHLNNLVICNVLQAYILRTNDDYNRSAGIVSQLSAKKIKVNTYVKVNGIETKFKKYLSDNKENLSAVSLQLCQGNKLFSIF
ncbi:MAG: hypothetical protein IKP88_12595 [Lachnospiraceae bacterium]|nr:hypothetical protein [Lachnospiraceae bacterium]